MNMFEAWGRATRRLFGSFVALTMAGGLYLALPTVAANAETPSAPVAKRPNIVILLVDDAAFMDFGLYGGEAHTPNIDKLGAMGAMFTGYRSSPLCAPSRAMLLTGMDNHLNGVATIPEIIPPEHVNKPGYRLSLEPGLMTIADYLKKVGYRTLMTGKWHLGSASGELPNFHGFDRSFALDASGADNWEDKSFMPFYDRAPWFEDGKPASLPKDFYSSKFIVDKMMDYIKSGPQDEPFFAYLAFQAIHIPVQAPKEMTAHYKGVYNDGWQALREKRYRKAIELGLIPADARLGPMPKGSRKWEDLSPEDKALYAARMQVDASMLEAMDSNVGRFIDFLRASGKFDNTIFVVTSDNGPAPSSAENQRLLHVWMYFHGYHTGIEGIGEKGSWGFVGPEWANAAASPSELFKFYSAEGGLRVPFIMVGPGIRRQRIDSFSMVTDVTPTLLDLAGVDVSATERERMTGHTLAPVLYGTANAAYSDDQPAAIEVSGNSALYLGRYKITRNGLPLGDNVWRLFDIVADPGETRDLSQEHPAVFAQLKGEYANYVKTVGVQPMPEGYDSTVQLARNSRDIMLPRYWWIPASLGLVLLGFLWGIWKWVRRLFA